MAVAVDEHDGQTHSNRISRIHIRYMQASISTTCSIKCASVVRLAIRFDGLIDHRTSNIYPVEITRKSVNVIELAKLFVANDSECKNVRIALRKFEK